MQLKKTIPVMFLSILLYVFVLIPAYAQPLPVVTVNYSTGETTILVTGTAKEETTVQIYHNAKTYYIDSAITNVNGSYVFHTVLPLHMEFELLVNTGGSIQTMSFSTKQPSNPGGNPGDNSNITFSVDMLTIGKGYVVHEVAVEITNGESVWDVTRRVLEDRNIPFEYQWFSAFNSVYVMAINGVGEFDNGPKSGWMYSVNGDYKQYGASSAYLYGGEVVKWRYTKDLGNDLGAPSPGDEENQTVGAGEVTVIAGGGSKASAGLSGTTLDNLIRYINSYSDKEEGLITITVDLPKTAESLAFTIPNELLEALNKKQKLSLRIQSDIGVITFNPAALHEMKNAAKNHDVVLTLSRSTDSSLPQGINRDMVVLLNYSAYLHTNSQPITEFEGGDAELFIPYQFAESQPADIYRVYRLDTDGTVNRVGGAAYHGDKKGYTVPLESFGDLIVGYYGFAQEDVKAMQTFIDVLESHWASEFIYYLAEKGIVSGVGNGYFMPDRNLTRAEFVTLLLNMSGSSQPDGLTKFNDVKAGAWYAPSIAWAFENGVTVGTSLNTFSPTEPITRQDMAVMIKRYMDLKRITPGQVNEPNSWADAQDIAEYATMPVTELYQMGIITGLPDQTFAPKSYSTRAQAATMMAKLLMAAQ